jgi:hypothetical protein
MLALLAGLMGARPIRIAALKSEFVATHPFVLCSLGSFGPLAAALADVAGVVGAAVARSTFPRPMRLAFNLGAVILATAASWGAFLTLGGLPGSGVVELLLPLAGAALAYFLVNTGLVALAVALEKRRALISTWRESFGWTTASHLTGLTLAVLLLVVLERLGPWALALGVPPCWLLATTYRIYRARLEDERRRVAQVERLNSELRKALEDLRESTAHVRRLQGLLPICMHCKKIRDDKDIWHHIEVYIAENSEARFTHSLCRACRDKHYPEVAGASRSTGPSKS